MRQQTSARLRSLPVLLISASLAGCGGGSPPPSQTRAEIEKSIRSNRFDLFECAPQYADVISVEVGGWKRQEDDQLVARGLPDSYATQWSARLRFKEAVGLVQVRIEGTKVVKIVLDEGDELEFKGSAHATKFDGKWEVGATVRDESGWTKVLEENGPITMGYPIIEGGLSTQGVLRGSEVFEPVSRLGRWVAEGSAELAALSREIDERQAKIRADGLARQKKAREAAAEKERVAREENDRREAEIAQKARDQLHARLLPVIEPLRSRTGAVMTSDAGPTLGSVILEVEADEPNLAVKGKGVDLREMPFRDFTIEATVDSRNGGLSVKSSIAAAPGWFRPAANGTLGGSGMAIAPLSEADRATIDRIAELGRKLQGAPPLDLAVEVIEPAAVKGRQAAIEVAGLSGTVFFRGRNDARVAGLFSGNLSAAKAYAWRKGEVVSIRLGETVRGSGLYFRGGGGPTDDLEVVVNGVHRARVGAVPKAGAAIISLPPGLEILDIRFEARGVAQTPGIALIR